MASNNSSLVGTLLGGAAPIVGGLFDWFGQKSANKESEEAAQKQMDFQRDMSNTQYQRSVADMRKAGINPMLASMSGQLDSSAAGSSYTAQNPGKGLGQVGAAASSSAVDWNRMFSEIYSRMAVSDKAIADASWDATSSRLMNVQGDLTRASAAGQGYENQTLKAIAAFAKEHPQLVGTLGALMSHAGVAGSIAGNIAKF
nr:MAG: DNA pilot protein [Microviridae sp.]